MEKPSLCIVGLGYVGLPLAHAFAKKGYSVAGYDVSAERIESLKSGEDWTHELTPEQLKEVSIDFSTDPTSIGKADIVILALPTPVDAEKNPDISILKNATETVGKQLKKGMIVVYESTVYPGTTEEICGPILEKQSGLACGKDFTLGYSPERINPGDKEHTVTKIKKVVAGQDQKTLDTLSDLYGSVIEAGIHKASSIQVAEMAKAIENAQRDLNIAFVNEIALLCNRIGIPTKDVLDAAATKWNFLNFKPGLVGGHCIGVDPYYLVEKAKMLGMQTHVITAGRAVNDSIAAHVGMQVADALGGGSGARVLVLGLTFKENVPDTRNSKSFDVIATLQAKGCVVEAHDPFAEAQDMKRWNLTPGSLEQGPYDAIVLLVPHKEYLALKPEAFINALKSDGVLYDLKSVLDRATFAAAHKQFLAL